MNHPITLPPELVKQWWDDFNGAFYEFEAITAKVFQAGADQELEACCQHVDWVIGELESKELRAARRPRQPSLKVRLSKAIVEGDERQALKLLEELDD